MSTNLRINALKTDIISDVATTLAEYDAQELDCRKKSQWTEFYATKAQEAGVKELAFMLKGLELSSVCDDYLKVEYREGANKNNRMMLSKRFIESFDDKDVETWFSGCEDQAILASICSAMGYETTPKTPIRTLRQVATAQVYEYGERIVLQRLNIDQLRAICEELNIEGSDYTSSKSVLVNAIMTNTDIEKKSAPKKRITRTKKKAIEDATKYQELFQHYYVADLQEWAAANGLKVSGTKKVLIERILAFNAGDTENTMATANTNRAPRKAATKKAAPAPNPPTKRVAAIASGVQSSKKIVCDVPKVSSKKTTTVTKNTKATTKKATNKTAPKSAKAPKKKEPAPVEVEEEEDEEIVEEEIVEEEDEDEVEEEEDQMEQDDQESGDEQDAEGSAEDESADEEPSLDEEAEKAAIDAERELRTVEDEEEEEPSEEMMLSEVSNDFPTDITGKLFAVSGLDDTSKHTKKELVKIITANGGQIARTLTKNVDVVITKEGTPAYKAALKVNIPCYGEEYLTNFF